MPTSKLLIDLGAIDRNVGRLRAVITPDDPKQHVALCAVVKQDAYGLGAARLARRLAASGVDMLAVYGLDEARALVEAPIRQPVLVLMPVSHVDRADPLYRLAVCGRLHLVLHARAQAQDLGALAGRMGLDLPVHIQVDTGLSRGGCLPDEAQGLLEFVAAAPRLRLAGVMTHFAAPAGDEEFTREQARRLRAWIERAKPTLAAAAHKGAGPRTPLLVHAASTVAALRSAPWHSTMIRAGQGLLGFGGEALRDEEHVEFAAAARSLEPCVRWITRIAHVQDVPAGWPVGYDRLWTAARPSRIALVPVGYANGYPRSLGGVAQVRLTGALWDRARTSAPGEVAPQPGWAGPTTGGHFVPVVGRVSMDQITLDVTGLPEASCKVGAEVELVGADPEAPNHLPTLAHAAGTITHELLCRVAPTVERVYVTSVGTAPQAPAPAALPVVVPARRAAHVA